MGLLDGLLGNASEINTDDIKEEFAPILGNSEAISSAYKVIRDLYVFTNKRLILVDKQGITGKKTDYHSIPYPSISHFAVETAGHFDLDAELKIWLSNSPEPITRELKGGSDMLAIQQNLANHMFSD